MDEIRIRRLEQGQTKIRNVPIAVTPEGFWCCPSPVVFQKTLKSQTPVLSKLKSSTNPQPTSVPKKPASEPEKKIGTSSSRSGGAPSEDTSRPKHENAPRKVTIEFGEPGTSDLKVVLLGQQGVSVKLNVHSSVLVKNSSYFAKEMEEQQQKAVSSIEFECLEDVEMCIETFGLMYCKDIRHRLMKQSVSSVLSILKVAEKLGFATCIETCLEYLEAVPWVGEEEESKVITSVMHLRGESNGIKPVLKRVSSEASIQPKDTLSQILELVLKSNEEKGRREMKAVVLKLLRENESSSSELCDEKIYSSCRCSLESLLNLFREATDFGDKPTDLRESLVKKMAFEADNLLWLLDILALRQSADEFAMIWSVQQELASLHSDLPIVYRHHISLITARLFIGIGRGEILPSKETRLLLLKTWLQQLINDYRWLQTSCRSFDRVVVEEGIGRTILTLPLEDQQSILLSWLGSFLKTGDNCPNLRKAFEVWWRRTFARPYAPEMTAPGKQDVVSGRRGTSTSFSSVEQLLGSSE